MQTQNPTQAKSLKVYGYHPNTFELLQGDYYADESPLEPGVYHLPQYTTRTPPAAPKLGYVLRYNIDADNWQPIRYWGEIPLYQTATGEAYRFNGPINGDVSHTFDGYGELPEGLTKQARPNSAYDWHEDSGQWLEDTNRAQALALMEAQSQMNAAVESVNNALKQVIAERFQTVNQSFGGNFKTEEGLMAYAGYDNAFRVSAEQFGAWTAVIWSTANAYKTEVISGTKPMLTPSEAVLMVPDYPKA